VIKTPGEVLSGSPLFLDMVEDMIILLDPEGFLQSYLDALRKRLLALGSKRICRDGSWHWLLKPDYVPGEVFEL
jgi:hypothetical protein